MIRIRVSSFSRNSLMMVRYSATDNSFVHFSNFNFSVFCTYAPMKLSRLSVSAAAVAVVDAASMPDPSPSCNYPVAVTSTCTYIYYTTHRTRTALLTRASIREGTHTDTITNDKMVGEAFYTGHGIRIMRHRNATTPTSPGTLSRKVNLVTIFFRRHCADSANAFK